MEHWHRCRRWWRRGLECPFTKMGMHDPGDGGPEPEDEGFPFPRFAVPGRKKAPPKFGGGLLEASEPFLAKLEDLYKEIAEGTPKLPGTPPEPFGLPPGRPPVPRPVRAPEPVRVPEPVRAGVLAPLRARAPRPATDTASRASRVIQSAGLRAIVRAFRTEGPGPKPFTRRHGRRKAAIAERATADEMGSRLGRFVPLGIAAGAGAAAAGLFATRPRGGGGGFFFNQAARMRALAGAPGSRRFGASTTGAEL